MFIDYYYCEVDINIVEICFVGSELVILFNDIICWVVGVCLEGIEENLLCEYIYVDGDFVSQYKFVMIVFYGQFDS